MPSALSASAASARITVLDVLDVRFPTSEHLDGSDAMNLEPDYSAAYAVLRTDAGGGLEGHALTFTTGRGNDVQAAAVAALAPHVVGLSVDDVCADLGAFSRSLVHDPQLRWLGPEKGAIHMATGAVVNAAWHLAAKLAGKPVRRFLGEMSPEDLVAQVDFRWLSDALTPEEALEILRRAEPGREQRIGHLLDQGYPAYTTTPGRLGYSDEKLARLAHEAVAEGFTQIKLKAYVGICGTDLHWSAETGFVSGPRMPGLRVLDRIGSGDAFAAGLIHGLLSDTGLESALAYGTAHGAFTMTTPGDVSMASLAEVEALIAGGSAHVRR
ncbi:L-alanine-DL-glutamate epimerase-like enolase superfamily enzyme [Streptomyces sp. V4I8]|uniref:PfkB family carbohydrate kinase n=1 Tax=Streptomyces sp. V4I8 TaxID=3156469 RepID=UPI0035144EBE